MVGPVDVAVSLTVLIEHIGHIHMIIHNSCVLVFFCHVLILLLGIGQQVITFYIQVLTKGIIEDKSIWTNLPNSINHDVNKIENLIWLK